jgi:hypothetical protein
MNYGIFYPLPPTPHPRLFFTHPIILPLAEKFRIYFSNYFCLEYELQNVFSEIYTRKSSGSKFRTFVCFGSRAKMKNRG